MKEMYKKVGNLFLLLGIHMLAFTQNPAIFKGGNGDGWISQNVVQGSNNIFKGGNGDGWMSEHVVQSSSNIFKGGFSDGWVSQNFQQANLVIFKGGAGDGWDSKNHVQSNINIFNGGIGDGWASTYKPQGPIPVVFMYFNAQKHGENEGLLSWETSQESNTAFFEIERSTDALNFSYLGRVAAAGNSSLPLAYNFTDIAPLQGLDYYRLKQVDLDGHFIYTPSRLLRFNDKGAGQIKYFPNPTNGIVYIELLPGMQHEQKLINIINAAGVVIDQLKLEDNSGTRIPINLGSYSKGVYFIQVKTASVNSTQQVVLE